MKLIELLNTVHNASVNIISSTGRKLVDDQFVNGVDSWLEAPFLKYGEYEVKAVTSALMKDEDEFYTVLNITINYDPNSITVRDLMGLFCGDVEKYLIYDDPEAFKHQIRQKNIYEAVLPAHILKHFENKRVLSFTPDDGYIAILIDNAVEY